MADRKTGERLATHYTYTVETCTLLLENVISDYLNFFKTKGLPIHTARVELTSLITTLFHVPLNSGSDVFTSEKYMYFANVKPMTDSPSSPIQLPIGCQLTITPDNEIQVSCPFHSSGDRQITSYCTIGLQLSNTVLSFNGFTFSLGIQVPLQSDRICGLISLVGKLRICNGVTVVNAGGDTKIEHVGTCERIFLPLSREMSCESCVNLKSLQEGITNIWQVVKTRQISSLEHTHIVENTCLPDKNESNFAEIQFASHDELLEQSTVSDRDSQHVFVDAEDSLKYCNELSGIEHLNERRETELPLTADSNDISEFDGVFLTNGLNMTATLEERLGTDVFDGTNQTKLLNQEQTHTDRVLDECGSSKENSRTVMIEDRSEEKMTDSDGQIEEDGDSNMRSDDDEFETLKPGCNYVGRDKYNLGWHIQRRHNKGCVYSCEFCGKQYKAAPDVDNHIKRVHTCRVCEKKIGTQQELKLHLNSDHSMEELKPLQCDICLQRFAQKQGLGMHLYRHHDRPLPKGTMWYHCDKCSYVSAFKNHLGKHRQLHEGTTVFTCEICQQAFFNQTGLTNHGLRMHKGVQWAKPGEAAKSNLCHICSRNFKFEKLLQLHLYKHHGQQLSDGYTWHRCEKCSFVTDIRVNLKAHTKKVHSGSVVHTCSVCKTAFISNAALKCHQLIHKGAICPQRDCPVICESEAELETHMQQEHEVLAYVVLRGGEPEETDPPSTRDPYPATCVRQIEHTYAEIGEKATHHKKKEGGRPKKKASQKRNPELSEESAESGSETDASVEFHNTDDDDNENKRSNKLSFEFDTDITELNETPAFTYELRQRKPRKYQQELECEFDEDTDDIEGN